MIVTRLEDINRYRGLSTNLDTAFDWLLKEKWQNIEQGKHAIFGEAIYALVQSYKSKEHAACRFEAHRSFIDIQMLTSGEEIIEALPREGLEVLEPYKPDIEFYVTPKDSAACRLFMKPGLLAIFFPEDAHRPCMIAGDGPEDIGKIVIKVAV